MFPVRQALVDTLSLIVRMRANILSVIVPAIVAIAALQLLDILRFEAGLEIPGIVGLSMYTAALLAFYIVFFRLHLLFTRQTMADVPNEGQWKRLAPFSLWFVLILIAVNGCAIVLNQIQTLLADGSSELLATLVILLLGIGAYVWVARLYLALPASAAGIDYLKSPVRQLSLAQCLLLILFLAVFPVVGFVFGSIVLGVLGTFYESLIARSLFSIFTVVYVLAYLVFIACSLCVSYKWFEESLRANNTSSV